MTIFDVVLEKEKNAASKRLEKLKKIPAPDVILKSLSEFIKNANNEVKKFKGMSEFGKLKVNNYEVKKGRGGKPFIEFDTKIGKIYFFPVGKYGAFLKKFD